MLLPPFTVLIVKKNRRPVTVRVTGWLVFIIFVLCGSVLLGTAMIAGRFAVQPSVRPVVATSPEPAASAAYVLAAPTDTALEPNGTAAADIAGFEVARDENGNVACTFSVANTPEGEELYLWIMVNPNTAESVIYPRNPLFHGLPVDYRNGIRHAPQNGHLLRLTFSGPESGITLDRFRILAYEPSGDLIIDKTLTVQKPVRM